jgi:hypothetical protein
VETIVNTHGEIVAVVDHTDDPQEPDEQDQLAGMSPQKSSASVPVVSDLAGVSGAGGGGGGDNTDATVANDAEGAANSSMDPVAADAARIAQGRASTVITGTGVMDEATEGEVDANRENALDGTAILDVPATATKTLESTGDLVVFMGDLNYRIKGNR